MLHTTATWEIFGNISLSISSRLASTPSGRRTVPGHGSARVWPDCSTSSLATGSDENIITTGIDCLFAAQKLLSRSP